MTEECRAVRRQIIWQRFIARRIIGQYNQLRSQIRELIRHKTLMEQRGISFILLDKRIQDTEQKQSEILSAIQALGELLMHSLDDWQAKGATLKDLCNLCNKPHLQAAADIVPGRLNEVFSKLIFVDNLDYLHDDSGFIDMDVDAPLTHCIKEHMVHLMLTDGTAKRAAREAMEVCFSELMAKAFTMATTEEGDTVYFDREGNEINPEELL